MHVATTRCGSGCAGADYAHGEYNKVYMPWLATQSCRKRGRYRRSAGNYRLGSITKGKIGKWLPKMVERTGCRRHRSCSRIETSQQVPNASRCVKKWLDRRNKLEQKCDKHFLFSAIQWCEKKMTTYESMVRIASSPRDMDKTPSSQPDDKRSATPFALSPST